MRHTYLACTLAVFGIPGLFAQPPIPGAPAADRKPYTILYTGRLMGYARTPDSQTLQTHGGDPNRIAAQYIALFKNMAEKLNPVGTPPAAMHPFFRLGMGDNFAPDLFARTFDTGAAVRQPKDRYSFYNGVWKWDATKDPKDPQAACREFDAGMGHTSIGYDNVAQFLVSAGYQVLVPGKHDFYYGPERLRDLARLLQKDDVRILGANLIVSTARAPQFDNVYPRTPERLVDHPYLGDFHSIAPDLPELTLPYKRQFVVKNGLRVTRKLDKTVVAAADLKKLTMNDVELSPQMDEAWICRETDAITKGDPADILPPGPGSNCLRLVEAHAVCAQPVGTRGHLESTCKKLSTEAQPKQDAVYLFRDPGVGLVAGVNHLFCAKFPGATKQTCKPFSVQMPFFSYGSAHVETAPTRGKGNDCPVGPEQTTPPDLPPYQVLTSNGVDLAVFGVVDPDLLTNVGLLNYGWRNQEDRWDTIAKAGPADYALQQALELCNSDEKCRTAPKVLMAQMSYAKAAQLLTQFGKEGFGAVISQADANHNTGDRDIVVSAADTLASQFVLTPPEPFKASPDPDAGNPNAIAAFTPAVSQADIAMGRSHRLRNRVTTGTRQLVTEPTAPLAPGPTAVPPPPPPPAGTPRITLAEASLAALNAVNAGGTASAPASAPAASDAVRDLALLAMKQKLRTDIAVLQTRDLFDADRLSAEAVTNADIQNQISRIFWKDDFAITLHMTGATLRKILKQSAKFDELDHDALATEVEKGRALLTLGVWKDPLESDSYYVNGTKLDDTLLYSAAATEFLGLGDTGYADLATPDVPPATRIEDFNHLYAIAGITCAFMLKTGPNKGIQCDTKVLDGSYFDVSWQRPFDQTPGFNALARYATAPKRLRPVPVGSGASAAEGKAQQRSFWTFNLEYLDFSYGGTFINHVSQAGRFAGISAAGVTTTGSHNVASDHKVRAIYDYGIGTWYAMNDSAFSLSSTTASAVPAISMNVMGFETGGTLRIFPKPRPSWLMVQYSTRYERQLTDSSPTVVTFKVPDPKIQPPDPAKPFADALPLFLDTPSLSAIYGRLGLRAEFADTYIEFGVEQVDARNLLKSYTFLTPLTPSGKEICIPTAGTPLACGADPTSNASSVTLDGPISRATAKPVIARTDYLTGGAYFNFNLKFPLWSKKDAAGADHSIYFQATNKFDLYFNSPADTSVQTRYVSKFTPSLSIPIYGKLTLTPKVDFILYENKLGHSVYRSMAPGVAISYSFKWREGMKMPRSLGYGAITQTPQTAGTPH